MAAKNNRISAKMRKLIQRIPGYDPIATAGDCWFDEDAAQLSIDFFPEYLKHVEGDKAGQPFVLEPWEQSIIANIFGWKRTDKYGRTVRRYREVFIYVPRKNGKTPLVAGIGLLVFFMDDEKGQQDYVAAADREQAGMLFRHCKGMVEQEPELASKCRVFGGNASAGQSRSIYRQSDGSFLRVVSADADTKHGGNSHLIVVDELHAQPNRELVDVFRTSMASANRKQPLMIYITTADYDRESICNETYERACRIRDGSEDNSFLPVIYEADIADDWESPKTWRKANPNIGVSVSEDYLESEVRKIKDNPSLLNAFLRLHLNVRTKANTRWIDGLHWRNCGGKVVEETLLGRECGGGLDLSAKYDLTSFVMVFPSEDRKRFTILPRFWIPEETAAAYQKKYGLNFTVWQRYGYINLTPGASVDYDLVEESIRQDSERFQLRAVAYDPWNANATRERLERVHSITMIEFFQSLKNFNEPCKEFGRLIRDGLLLHGENPVMNWNADSVEVYTDSSGNIRPVKPKDGTACKIDGIVAAIMGLSIVMQTGETASKYERDSMLVL